MLTLMFYTHDVNDSGEMVVVHYCFQHAVFQALADMPMTPAIVADGTVTCYVCQHGTHANLRRQVIEELRP